MSVRLKQAIRRAIVLALYYSGLLWILIALRLRGRAVVLTYHRVLPPDVDSFSADGVVVSPATFTRQMRFLRRHFRLIALDSLADALESRTGLPNMSCAVTFDDGWIDNFEHALPILRANSVPAAVFVATGYVGTNRCLWQERLTRTLFERAEESPWRELIEQHAAANVEELAPIERRRAARAAVAHWKREPPARLEALEKKLRTVPPDVPSSGETGYDRFMSWQQVAAMTVDSAVSIGSHGHSHTPFTRLPAEEARHELERSRAEIGAVLDRPPTAIAYPNGDYDDGIVAQAKEAGYRLGFTTDRGYVGVGSDPMRVCRINIHEASTATMPDFLCTLAGVFSGYRTFKAARANARSRHGQ